MKRTVKKLAAVGLTLTTVMGLVACGSSDAKETTTKAKAEKPEKFTVMVDGTVVKDTNGGELFYEYLKSIDGGVDIEWIRPDHAGYYDAVGIAFNSEDTMPDVLVLSSDYYSAYAANGFLWDMTDAWEASETKNSGRLIEASDAILDALLVNGEDGKPAMYGYSPYRGNGCVTFVKESWLTLAGYTKADVEGKQLTFAQYYEILKKMHTATGKTVISAAGFVNKEAPYTNYLPEFYQKADFTFYKDASGKYVDGFSTTAMKDALTRIATAVKDGVIDQESVNNETKDARNKFYADNTGVFTYWAGTWAETIRANLASRGLDDSVVTLSPIKELGTYVERIAPCFAITTHAGDNSEAIFTWFIDQILDGGDVQTAWTYGAKGAHWDTKAETTTVKDDKTAGKIYKEGEFHMLAGIETTTAYTQKNFIDPTLSLGKFIDGDPGKATLTDLAIKNQEFFSANSKVAVAVPMTDALSENINDINTQRQMIVAGVCSGRLTAEEGMTEYTAKVGSLVDTVLKSLNK